jgi:hypothetical protein
VEKEERVVTKTSMRFGECTRLAAFSRTVFLEVENVKNRLPQPQPWMFRIGWSGVKQELTLDALKLANYKEEALMTTTGI